MYITRLKLNNIKCFSEVDLDLSRSDGSYAGWTVFAGKNGTGKSTILQTAAMSLTGFGEGLFEPESFLRKGAGSWEASMKLGRGAHDTRIETKDPLWCSLTWRPGFRKEDRVTQGIEYLPQPGWYLAGYGPFRRLSGQTSEALELMARSTWPSRVLTLFRSDASLAESVTWLRDVDYRSLKGSETERYRKLKKDALRILADGLLPDDAEVEDVDTDGLKVKLQGESITLDQLSDGYRAVTALVVDLLRTMFQRFGQLKVAESAEGAYPVVLHDGVVLIDEVETHLHISWQRQVGFWLKKHFPNIQFLVSTHSPYVCQAADERGLIRLPDPRCPDERVEHVDDNLFRTIVNGTPDDAAVSNFKRVERMPRY